MEREPGYVRSNRYSVVVIDSLGDSPSAFRLNGDTFCYFFVLGSGDRFRLRGRVS